MLRDRGVNARLALCLNSVLNVKAVVAAFNQEEGPSVITNLRMELFEALMKTLMKMSHFLSYPLAFRYLDIILMVKISQQHILSTCRKRSTIYYMTYIIYTITWSVVSWMLNWTLRWT